MTRTCPRRYGALQLVLALSLALQTSAISLSARRIQTTFSLVTNSTRCPETVTHAKIQTFRNVNPADPAAVLDTLLWSNLQLDSTKCVDSVQNLATQSTYFVPQARSPPGTPPDTAQPFFLIGRDNSPRKCTTHVATLPASYFFTEDLPTFRDRLIRQGFIGPDVAPAAVRGDIYMLVTPISDDVDVLGRTCAYVEEGDLAPQTPQPAPVDMPACFPADALASGDAGALPMASLRVGDRVSTPAGMQRVVSFTHRSNELHRFVSLHLDNNRTVELSKGHLILANGRMTPAGEVTVRDRLSPGGVVVAVSTVSKRGLYAPITPAGTLYVNGVLVSCYTTAVDEIVAHALLGPVRALNRVMECDICGVADALRLLLWGQGSNI